MSSLHEDPWSAGASRAREQLLEHQFLGEVVRRMLLAGRRCEVLRAEFDASGHDVVLESEGVLRHVQLKAMRADGRRADVNIHTALAGKPSGCVIWMLVDPTTLTATGFLWFGGAPGEPLPDLGDRAVRHTRGDATGAKAFRPELREVRRSRFETITDYELLIERLFGTTVQRDVGRLRLHLRQQLLVAEDAPAWLAHAQAGRFASLPDQFSELQRFDFAHLVDGYELAGISGPAESAAFLEGVVSAVDQRLDIRPHALWAALFLEHRRLRFEGREPTAMETNRLDQWTRLLVSTLKTA